jgi:capsid assembly protease
MRARSVISEVYSTPWAIEPSEGARMLEVLERWASGEAMTLWASEQIAVDQQARNGRRAAATSASGGGIAVMPLYGVLTQRGNMMDAISGAGSISTDMFASQLREAMDDDAVGQILIDVDSPGGNVYGIMELADLIYQARAKKPITAIANSMAASAAYWVSSQAGQLYVTPGGEVGSIGVFTTHTDKSEALKQMGLKTTLISAGKNKVEGNPYGPLEDDARAFLQSRVDDMYSAFTSAVARGRAVPVAQVRDDMGGGRLLGAKAALNAGMVDGVMTFDDLLQKMRKSARSGPQPSAAAPQPSKLAQARRRLQLMG